MNYDKEGFRLPHNSKGAILAVGTMLLSWKSELRAFFFFLIFFLVLEGQADFLRAELSNRNGNELHTAAPSL